MTLMKRLRRMACRHEYGWAERRQAEVCYHCGKARLADETDGRVEPAPLDRPADAER
jgi:hypothetical protein